jgi:hypothetical protein
MERFETANNSRKMSLKASKRFVTARSTVNFSEFVLTNKCKGTSF